jgi:hypothetical protein
MNPAVVGMIQLIQAAAWREAPPPPRWLLLIHQ